MNDFENSIFQGQEALYQASIPCWRGSGNPPTRVLSSSVWNGRQFGVPVDNTKGLKHGLWYCTTAVDELRPHHVPGFCRRRRRCGLGPMRLMVRTNCSEAARVSTFSLVSIFHNPLIEGVAYLVEIPDGEMSGTQQVHKLLLSLQPCG